MKRTALFLCALVLFSNPTAAQERTPYLQMGSPTSMTVAWRTTSATEGSLCFGRDIANLDRRVTGPTQTDHALRADGLTPNTRYYYLADADCRAGDVGDPNRYFVTSPPHGTREPTRIWVVGDSGTGGSRQGEVRDAMLDYVGSDRPDLFLHMGDMAYGSGTESEFTRNFFGMYPTILENTVCWPTMGNHEGYTSDGDEEEGPYFDAYVLPRDGSSGGLASGTEAYYSFDYANIHFIVLDSYDVDRRVDGPMMTWLEEDLAATDQDWIIAYWHHPAYTDGSHNSDNEGPLIDMREHALPILEAGGADLILAGHSHIYERSYLINGAYDTPTSAEG